MGGTGQPPHALPCITHTHSLTVLAPAHFPFIKTLLWAWGGSQGLRTELHPQHIFIFYPEIGSRCVMSLPMLASNSGSPCLSLLECAPPSRVPLFQVGHAAACEGASLTGQRLGAHTARPPLPLAPGPRLRMLLHSPCRTQPLGMQQAGLRVALVQRQSCCDLIAALSPAHSPQPRRRRWLQVRHPGLGDTCG